jgi:hypothetical protein
LGFKRRENVTVSLNDFVKRLVHPRLIGDDRGVLSIGLPVTAVGARGVMHGPSGDVAQLLVIVEQPA